MPVTHEPWLVALSVVVAIQGAYVGLSLAVEVAGAVGARRRRFLAGAALSLGVAIWSMHFVAMLAARLSFPVDYLVFPTLLSFLVCVLVVGAAVFAVSAGPPTTARLVASAVFMGLGIVSMHYIGMAALHDSAHMSHSPYGVAGSVVIAIAASGLALRLATRAGRVPLFLSATALGLAIVVAVVAFVVSGLFLLVLVPERAATRQPGGAEPADAIGIAPVSAAASAVLSTAATPPAAPIADSPLPAATETARYLPVEHDGVRHLVPVDSIVAVHANAHYTYVFDGTAKHFCPLAIGDVESRLDPTRFARVHRSHIINIESIVRFKRAGDNGVIELKSRDHYTVPVSRSRVAWVRAQLLGPKASAAV